MKFIGILTVNFYFFIQLEIISTFNLNYFLIILIFIHFYLDSLNFQLKSFNDDFINNTKEINSGFMLEPNEDLFLSDLNNNTIIIKENVTDCFNSNVNLELSEKNYKNVLSQIEFHLFEKYKNNHNLSCILEIFVNFILFYNEIKSKENCENLLKVLINEIKSFNVIFANCICKFYQFSFYLKKNKNDYFFTKENIENFSLGLIFKKKKEYQKFLLINLMKIINFLMKFYKRNLLKIQK